MTDDTVMQDVSPTDVEEPKEERSSLKSEDEPSVEEPAKSNSAIDEANSETTATAGLQQPVDNHGRLEKIQESAGSAVTTAANEQSQNNQKSQSSGDQDMQDQKISDVPHGVPAPLGEVPQGVRSQSLHSVENEAPIVVTTTEKLANTDTIVPSNAAPSPESKEQKSSVIEEQTLPAQERQPDATPARIYLKEQVNDYLLEGMKWIVLARPENGLLALSRYLCSADAWRQDAKNAKKEIREFHSYWLSYQTWLSQGNANGTEQDYQATL